MSLSLLGTMIDVSTLSALTPQNSVALFSCVRAAMLPLNVRVEERQVLLLLLLSIRVTPLIFSDGSIGVPPAVTLRVPVHTVLDQLRTPPLLVQVSPVSLLHRHHQNLSY